MRKWLSEDQDSNVRNFSGSRSGDVPKAAQSASALRADFPEAVFTLQLCTNQQPDEQEMQKVWRVAQSKGLSVEFLSRSQLEGFLDVNPSGQYLRKRYLGIESELVSRELLVELGEKSLEAYGQRFILDSPSSFVRNSQVDSISTAIHEESSPLVVLHGASGVGKSVSAFVSLRDHLARGHCGFWIPAEIALSATQLSEAIDRTLRVFHPTIEPDAGQKVSSLLIFEEHCLVVVDDINKTGSAREILRKLASWSNPGPDNSLHPGSSPTKFKIIVPTQDVVRAQIGFEAPKWARLIWARGWSKQDSRAYLRSRISDRISEGEIHSASEQLSQDPILLAIFASLATSPKFRQVPPTAESALRDYVDTHLGDSPGRRCAPADLWEALVSLASYMLREREFNPFWVLAKTALPPEVVSDVVRLASSESICTLSGAASDQRFSFKHDRILELFAAAAVRPLLLTPGENEGILTDPFYARYVASSVIHWSDEGLLSWLVEHAPLALVEAVRYLRPDLNLTSGLVATLSEWFSRPADRHSSLATLHWFAAQMLQTVASPLVLSVSEKRRGDWSIQLARFANGDAHSGLLSLSARGGFSVTGANNLCEDALFQAFDLHRGVMLRTVRETLEGPTRTKAEFYGALALAGFSQEPGLAELVSQSWTRSEWREDFFELAFWAFLRCGGPALGDYAQPLVAFWENLPAQSSEGRFAESTRTSVGVHLSFAMKYGLPEESVAFLRSVGSQVNELQRPIGILLHRLFTPASVEYVVESAARSMERARESGGHDMWASDLARQWRGDEENREALPGPLLQVVESLAKQPESPAWLREGASYLWISTTKDLCKLALVSEDDPQYSNAVWRRAELADPTVSHALADMVRKRSGYWYYASRVWGPELEAALRESIARSDTASGKDDYNELAEVLRDIPVAVSEPILKEYWHTLGQQAPFVQLALFLGTEDMLQLAHDAVSSSPEPSHLFEYVSHFYGFGLRTAHERLRRRHFDVLIPYLDLFSVHDLSSIIMGARFAHIPQWSYDHVRPVADHRFALLETEEDRDVWSRLVLGDIPTDDELKSELTETVRDEEHGFFHAHIWGEGFARRGDTPTRMSEVLRSWLHDSPGLTELRRVVEILSEHGTRADLEWLRVAEIQGDQDGIADLKKRASIAVMRRSLK
jgi:hypothetical protein